MGPCGCQAGDDPKTVGERARRAAIEAPSPLHTTPAPTDPHPACNKLTLENHPHTIYKSFFALQLARTRASLDVWVGVSWATPTKHPPKHLSTRRRRDF